MPDIDNQSYDHDGLIQFLAEPKAIERLVSLIHLTCIQDVTSEGRDAEINYVADQIVRMAQSININDSNIKSVDAQISQYMEDGRMPEVASYVLNNINNVSKVEPSEMTSSFQDMVMVLNELDKQQGEMAKAIIFYGVGLAEYEWKDRRRGGIEYDVEEHGPICLSILGNDS